jgi:hypothetical protein
MCFLVYLGPKPSLEIIKGGGDPLSTPNTFWRRGSRGTPSPFVKLGMECVGEEARSQPLSDFVPRRIRSI